LADKLVSALVAGGKAGGDRRVNNQQLCLSSKRALDMIAPWITTLT
jgi:uncharacterized Ntn-hydrolase superfamily protein